MLDTRRQIQNREIVERYKSTGCVSCTEKEFISLDIHHVEPNNKSFAIGDVVGSGSGCSTQRLGSELEKCVCICVICHRKYHAGNKEVEDAIFKEYYGLGKSLGQLSFFDQ